MTAQPSLFETPPPAEPQGLRYQADFITPDAQRALVDAVAGLPVVPFEFGPYRGLRRVAWFGWKYDYDERRRKPAAPIPDFLRPLRARAEHFAGVAPGGLEQVLVTEYRPGAGIGWHRDRPDFGRVVGVSLLSPCTFRFRRKAGDGWERVKLTAEPRSAYVLDGPARYDWEHSIPAVDALRYSITLREMI